MCFCVFFSSLKGSVIAAFFALIDSKHSLFLSTGLSYFYYEKSGGLCGLNLENVFIYFTDLSVIVPFSN